MASADVDITLETIAPSKLLNYVTKERLVQFVSPAKYAEIEQRLRRLLDKSRVNLKDVKKHLSNRPEFIDSLRRHAIGTEAFDKYLAAVGRLQGIDRTRSAAVRKVMAEPRRRYKGCLATRLMPSDYEHCLDNYDDAKHDGMALVPAALQQRVYDRGDIATRHILEPTLTRKGHILSGMPAGYRDYISKNPDKFKNYFEQRRHELGLMKSVMYNLSNDDKRKLQAYYATHKTIQPEKFSEIIASFHDTSGTPAKRSRPPATGGSKGRFDLEQRLRDSELYEQSFGMEDLSISEVLEE